mgnify:FL=1
MQLPFELDRPLLFFDLETTGLDVRNDRIIELALIKLTPQGDVLERERRFNPGISIPSEATAIHGITDADVANELAFDRTANNLLELFDNCDLAGFNIKGFDLPLLINEFRRCRVEFSLKGRRILDMQAIFHREESRDLSAAARFYLGRDHEEAHAALGDIRTSAAVLGAQLERYDHVPKDLNGLHTYCAEYAVGRWFSGPKEARAFKRGKHNGQLLSTVAREAPDYLQWMLGLDDMDEDVRDVVRAALDTK